MQGERPEPLPVTPASAQKEPEVDWSGFWKPRVATRTELPVMQVRAVLRTCEEYVGFPEFIVVVCLT